MSEANQSTIEDFKDSLRKFAEEIYREGFEDGVSHRNIEWKHPPEAIAFLRTEFRRANSPTPENDKAWLEAWREVRLDRDESLDWSWSHVFDEKGNANVCDVRR